MNRLLLAGNVLLAVFLVFRISVSEPAAQAAEREWTVAAMRAIVGDDIVVDLGAELPGAGDDREPLDLGLRLEPMRDFVCYRISPRQLRLVPGKPLPPARRFHLHFGSRLVAEDGRTLAAGSMLAFETARQSVRSVHVEDVDGSDAPPTVVLEFGHAAALAAVRECVHLAGPDGQLPCSVEPVAGTDDSFRLLPTAPVPDQVEVVVDAKATPTGGELPMAGEVRRRVALYEPLELRSAEAGDGRLDLQFNRAVPLPQKGLLTVEPDVPFQVLRHRGGLRLVGAFAAGTVWSVRLGDGFPGSGRLRLRHATSRSVLVRDLPSELRLAQSGSVLSAKAVPQLQLTGVNVGEIAVRLRPVYTNNVVRMLQRRDEWVFAPAEVHRIAVHAARNQEFTETIDLPLLLGGRAHGLYQVEVWDGKGSLYPQQRLLQVTDLGVSVRAADDAIAVQVTGIAGGEAVAAADVEVVSPTNQVLCRGRTDMQGVALLRWPAAAADRTAFLVHVQSGDDEVFVDRSGYGVELADAGLGGRPFLQHGCEAYVWPTRGIVRPGERFDAAVVLRDADGSGVADRDVAVRFVEPGGRIWRARQLRSGGSGMIDVGLDLGADAPTGAWRLEVRADDQLVGSAGFLVEAFVPNRLEARIVEVPPLGFGQSATVRVHANWLEGSPAAGRPVQLRTRLLPGTFTAAGFDGYSFAGNPDAVPPGELDVVRGALDEHGDAEIVVAMPPQARQQVLRAEFALEVLDPSGRAVHAAATALVLRPQFQLGVHATAASAELAVVDADGAPCAGQVPVTVRLERRSWQWHYENVGGSRWCWRSQQRSEVIGEWHVTSSDGRGSVALPPSPGEGWLTVIASSGDQEVEQDVGRAAPRPDRLRVTAPTGPTAPGGSVPITVTSPASGRGFVTVESATIVSTMVVSLAAGDNRIDVALPADLRVPNVHVVVTLTRPALLAKPGDGPPWLLGGTSVALQRDDVATTVTLTAPAQVLPETEVVCSVHAAGAVQALVALVDEGVLQITEHQDPDPLAFFLAPRRLAAAGADTGAHLLQGMTFVPGSKTGGDGGDETMALGGSISPLIRPLALCRVVDLDADGNGRVGFHLPVYEGRVRWLCIAAGPAVVGAAAVATVVKAPLGLQLAGPRMVAPQDRFAVPVTLRNDTGEDGVVQLQWQVDGGLSLSQPPSQVTLAANAITTIDVEVTAAAPPSGATPALTVTAVLGAHHRRVEQPILVRSPSAFATDHVGIALGAAQDLTVPADFEAHDLQLSLRLSSHPDQQLRPALEALLHYPYGCLEQTTSKGMALLACQALLPRILGNEAETVQAAALVQSAVDRLLAMQCWNGGFAWWPGSAQEYEFGTVYAVDFLLAAQAARAVLPEQAMQRAVDRVQALASGGGELPLRCHAIAVLARAGRPVQPQLDWLCRCELAAEDRAVLAAALAQLGEAPRALAMLRDGSDDAGEDDDGAREQDGLLRSPLRLAALRFRALFAADPASPRLPEQALRLQQAVLQPAALTTQEQAQVLRALAEYFRVQPPATAPQPTGSFAGAPLPPAVDGVVTLPARPGAVLHLDAGGAGFALLTLRGFRPVSPTPVTGDVQLRCQFVDPDTGAVVTRLRRGRVYDVRIDGHCRQPLQNVVITDLLPGGVEAELPCSSALAAPAEPAEVLAPTCIERRDDRVLLFLKQLPGQFTLQHRVRAVFAGDFACPPLLAQAMYTPGSSCAGAAMPRLEILP